jgi:tRNA splicing ligase
VSLNFTREAFFDKEWNDLTIRARGLFVNTKTKEIVARSYEKFFNFEENDSMKLSELRRNMTFPANAYIKYNGYLGIVGYDSEKDELFISTKSSNQGNHQKYFKIILSKAINLDLLKDFCKNQNQSLVFEVIDPINDPHIIEYEEQKIVLLDCIDRTWDFHRTYNLYDIAKQFNFVPKYEAFQFKDYNEFYKFVEDVDNENFKFEGEYIEGFVIEDSNGLMVKFKTKYYKFWKFMRAIKEKIAGGHTVNTAWFTSAIQNKVYAFLNEKGREYCNSNSIIQLRKEFESEK